MQRKSFMEFYWPISGREISLNRADEITLQGLLVEWISREKHACGNYLLHNTWLKVRRQRIAKSFAKYKDSISRNGSNYIVTDSQPCQFIISTRPIWPFGSPGNWKPQLHSNGLNVFGHYLFNFKIRWMRSDQLSMLMMMIIHLLGE